MSKVGKMTDHSRRPPRPRRRPAKAKADRLRRDAVIIDGQGVGVLLPTALVPPPPVDGRAFLDRVLEAGISAMNVTLGISGIGMGVDDLRSMLNTVHGYLCYFELEADRVIHVQTVRDILRAKREGKLGVIFGVQGLSSKIDNDPNLIRILHQLGLRIAQLTYNERTPLGCGCLEDPDTGLTELGRVSIQEMNHLGIVVDLSHAGERTAREAIESSLDPVVVSHANVRALCDHPRNLTDDLIRALAGRAGVLGITAFSPFCETTPGIRPDLDAFIDHVAHVADLVGIDHVGVGSDLFEGESEVRFEMFFRLRYPDIVRHYTKDTAYAEGFDSVSCFPKLTERLVQRGFAPPDVRKVLGGNFLRVFRAVW